MPITGAKLHFFNFSELLVFHYTRIL